jgi:uncharacterized glyoxalase superfamily protein PhnB
MIDWLCGTFGFQRHAVHDDGKGGIAHAQLTLGSGMIMLGSTRDGHDEFGQLQSMPAQLGGTTQSPYVVVADADAIYGQAKTAGAEIVTEIKDEDYGGRGFSCRDPGRTSVEYRHLRSLANVRPARQCLVINFASRNGTSFRPWQKAPSAPRLCVNSVNALN